MHVGGGDQHFFSTERDAVLSFQICQIADLDRATASRLAFVHCIYRHRHETHHVSSL